MMKSNFEPIAIIGYGCIYPPDSFDSIKFWENIKNNKTGITKMSPEYWDGDLYYDANKTKEDKTYCDLGGVIEDYHFSCEELRKEYEKNLNTSQKMLLDTIFQALRMGDIPIENIQGDKAILVVGNMLGDPSFANHFLLNRVSQIISWMKKGNDIIHISEEKAIEKKLYSNMKKIFFQEDELNLNRKCNSTLCKAVADILNINGPSYLVDGACSSSILAINEAIKNIQSGDSEIAIVSGVLGNMLVTGNIAFSKIGGLSEYGSFPLSSNASGLVPSEGVGTVIIKKLSEAIYNNKIYGVIRGIGVASDGKGKSIYAPSSTGQKYAMEKSILLSGINKSDINYVETHATGTKVGDKVELKSIEEFFEDSKMKQKSVAIGSIKSQIGHSFSAAGMANLIKLLEGFSHETMPPTHNIERFVSEDMLTDSPFYVNDKLSSWPNPDKKCVSINAFGFGGINANVIVESFNESIHIPLIKSLSRQKKSNMRFSIVGVGCIDEYSRSYEEWKEKSYSQRTCKEHNENDFSEHIKSEIYKHKSNLRISYIKDLKFNCLRYKIPPRTLAEIDRSQQLALMTADSAIQDFGQDKLIREKTGIYIGSMMGLEASLRVDMRIRYKEYIKQLNEIEEFNILDDEVKNSIINNISQNAKTFSPPIAEDALPGYMDNIIAGRISNFFDCLGSNATYDADSVSFVQALKQGILSLQTYENDIIVVGGVHGNLMPEFIDLLKDVNKEECIASEGSVFFVIKREQDVTENDRIYANISKIRYDREPKKYGNINNNHASIYVSENDLSTENKNYFYYGAQGGFQLLKALSKLEDGMAKNATVDVASILGGNYIIEMDTIAGAGNSEIEEENCNIINVGADKIEELIENLTSKKAIPVDEMSEYLYRVSIAFEHSEDLEDKINFLKNIYTVS